MEWNKTYTSRKVADIHWICGTKEYVLEIIGRSIMAGEIGMIAAVGMV
jgi:hypothetical protein